MRKIAAILLLVIVFFNAIGYRFVITALQNKASQHLESKLDADEYDESELIEIRVPLNMPYQQRFTSFERYYGDIEIEGVHYKYVKRKIDGDQVIFKCIIDTASQILNGKSNELTKLNTEQGNTENKNKETGKIYKSFLVEYDDKFYSFNLRTLHLKINSYYSRFERSGQNITLDIPYPPPRQIV